MRRTFAAAKVIALLCCAGTLWAQGRFPRVTMVNPMRAKIGDTITATGENLDKDNVAEFFLTDTNNDYKVQVTEQSATAIKFTVPDSLKAGRFGLVARTPGTEANPPKDYVQPVKLTVE
jgi:hypothetical protein